MATELYPMLRTLRLLPPLPVTREAALAAAQDACRRRGWDAAPAPGDIRPGLRVYHVRTPADLSVSTLPRPRRPLMASRTPRRSWALLVIDGTTGEVLRARLQTAGGSAQRDTGEDGGPAAAGCPARPRPTPPAREAGNANELPVL